MAVKLRLMRMGKKKQPTYRVVAADSRAPRNGRFIEIVGFYEPRQNPSTVRIDNDRAVHWLRHGAQPTDRVRKLLEISGAMEAFRSPTGAAADGTVVADGVGGAGADGAGAAAAADGAGATDAAAGSPAADSTATGTEVVAGGESAGSGS